MKRLLCIIPLVLSLAGCLSPTYTTPAPSDTIPHAYKEEDGGRAARPADDAPKGDWWLTFNDPTLNGLIAEADAANQNIASAAANLRRARAQAATARAAFFPTLGATGSALRASNADGPTTASYSGGMSAQWEVSFWNAIPAYEASKAGVQATAADYASMRLLIRAEVAQNYFQLRTLDMQHDLYESTIAAYAKAVQLTRSQFREGMVTASDVAQAEAQLASAEAQLAALDGQRATLEHSLAVLLGKLPSNFTLERGELTASLPNTPTGLPGTLLERRPDIAGAERRVAVANEMIGVARAAWFPTVTLGASGILSGDWLTAPLTTWSLGPQAALSLFDGGKRLAQSDVAWAEYEGTVATYRQTVLDAFKDVEDSLSSLTWLARQAEAQDRAVAASETALRLSLSQYRGGMTTYLQVVSTQTAALTARRQAIEVQGQRLASSVNLIKALGGGFQRGDLDKETE
jgi:NodT family efflux transporter outer membrane factor (OMF) lipoprotein